IAVAVFRPHALWAAGPVLLVWMTARPLARWLDRPLRPPRKSIGERDEAFLREAALKTWRFFSEFSGPQDHWLIPDNIQGETLDAARRISPTNLGFLFNARQTAYELGFVTLERFVGDTEKSLASAKQLPRYAGHFLNWYTTDGME